MPSNHTRWQLDFPHRVREIAGARGRPESELFDRALEHGLEAQWEDLVLAREFDGELDCEGAVECVGRTKVHRAERERAVGTEDVGWGMNV